MISAEFTFELDRRCASVGANAAVGLISMPKRAQNCQANADMPARPNVMCNGQQIVYKASIAMEKHMIKPIRRTDHSTRSPVSIGRRLGPVALLALIAAIIKIVMMYTS